MSSCTLLVNCIQLKKRKSINSVIIIFIRFCYFAFIQDAPFMISLFVDTVLIAMPQTWSMSTSSLGTRHFGTTPTRVSYHGWVGSAKQQKQLSLQVQHTSLLPQSTVTTFQPVPAAGSWLPKMYMVLPIQQYSRLLLVLCCLSLPPDPGIFPSAINVLLET